MTLDVLRIPRGLSIALQQAELSDESVARVQRNELLLDRGKAFQLIRKQMLAPQPSIQLSR